MDKTTETGVEKDLRRAESPNEETELCSIGNEKDFSFQGKKKGKKQCGQNCTFERIILNKNIRIIS